ncbi:MAG: hypothetical protein KDI50_12095 [Candidatus Competibacteraceae bacterium]|nr:hypothetical protein [Candidatus Competibacteraceae bacterium]
MHSDQEHPILDDEESEPLYHRDKSGHFAFTERGADQYRKRFARFGIRVETIHTLEDFQDALALSQAAFIDELVAIARNGPRSLERNLLIAVARGDKAEHQRLLRLVKRRNALDLQVI